MCGDAGCTINPLIVIFPSPTAICCPYDPRLHVFPTRHSSVHHPTLCVLPPFIYHIHNYPPHIALPLDVITSPLNQSTLLHLLSKFLAFLAFIAFKGLKRPKKAEKKLLPNDLELSNLVRNQIWSIYSLHTVHTAQIYIFLPKILCGANVYTTYI